MTPHEFAWERFGRFLTEPVSDKPYENMAMALAKEYPPRLGSSELAIIREDAPSLLLGTKRQVRQPDGLQHQHCAGMEAFWATVADAVLLPPAGRFIMVLFQRSPILRPEDLQINVAGPFLVTNSGTIRRDKLLEAADAFAGRKRSDIGSAAWRLEEHARKPTKETSDRIAKAADKLGVGVETLELLPEPQSIGMAVLQNILTRSTELRRAA